MSVPHAVIPVLAAAVLGSPGTVLGQPVADSEELSRVLFEDGVAALERADYVTALDRFLRSYELKPKSVALFNAGMCYRAIDDPVAADATLRRYLATSEGDEAERIAEAARVLRELDRVLGQVVLELRGAPAQVLLDGRHLGPDATERPLRVTAGPHDLEAVWPEGSRAQVRVEVGPGRTVEAVLERTPGDGGIELPVGPAVPPPPAGAVGDDLQASGPLGEEAEPAVDGGLATEWWFWTIVGVVVVGTGIGLGVGLGMPDQGPEPDWRVVGPP